MTTSEIEMERKYLIKDEGAFGHLLGLLKSSSSQIGSYQMQEYGFKEREYRYFDNFDGDLAAQDLQAYVGPLEREGASASLRDRGEDKVLTIKFKTGAAEERSEEQFTLPKSTNFYRFDPNEVASFWEPMQRVREKGKNLPLQEVVRLQVKSNRFNLYRDEGLRVEVAVDDVLGKVPWGVERSFYELEIEVRGCGKTEDKESVSSFFAELYCDSLIKSSVSKWIKALRLIRGQEIVAEE